MVLDLSLSTSLEVVTQQVAHMVQRGIPIRFGVIPMFDSESDDICESSVTWRLLTGSDADGQAVPVLCQDFRSRKDVSDANGGTSDESLLC
jgi:hypothetical protein